MTTTTGKRPTHRAKYEITNAEGKTVREVEIGAGWASEGKGPLRIKLDVAVSAGSVIKIWPVTERATKDPEQEAAA